MLLSQVGEHDLIGTIELPLEDWDAGGPEEEDFLILSEPEMVRAMRSGEEDQMVRQPVKGHDGKDARATLRFRFDRLQVCCLPAPSPCSRSRGPHLSVFVTGVHKHTLPVNAFPRVPLSLPTL